MEYKTIEKGRLFEKGEWVGRYQILELLGEGGTARVYKVRKDHTTQLYAMKISADRELLSREANMLKEMNYRYFPEFQELVEYEDLLCLVMEYVSGISLVQLEQQWREGIIAIKVGNYFYDKREDIIYALILEICSAITILHVRQPTRCYRDMKPEHFILRENGQLVVIDLGAAADSTDGSGLLAGTPLFCAPEQLRVTGMRPDPTGDVYGMGLLFVYMITGKNPSVFPDTMKRYCRNISSLSREWQTLLYNCLQEDPRLRYPDAYVLRQRVSKTKRLYNKGHIWDRSRKGIKWEKIRYEMNVWRCDSKEKKALLSVEIIL